jgi:hypothetical protein
MYSETCFYFLLQKASRMMETAMNNLFSWKEYARRTFDGCLRP